MKRIIAFVISLIMILCILPSCGEPSLSGKTFVFDKIETEGLSEEEKTQVQLIEAIYKLVELTFDEKTVKLGSELLSDSRPYIIKDGKVYVGIDDASKISDAESDDVFTIKGNTLAASFEEDGIKLTIIFREK